MPLAVGDSLSPGWASEKGTRRLPISEARTIMKIPVMPISYADATPLLRTHIANLRRKIEPAGSDRRLIRTESGVGYRFGG